MVKRSIKMNVAIVCGRFNDFISKRLLNACLIELKRQGLTEKQISVVWVPGSFEMPVVAHRLAKKKNIQAVICLGAIIRGETYHFEAVANECSHGLMQVSILTGKPIMMGVLTCDTIDQAYKRAGEKGQENKGRDCAIGALEMIGLLKTIK